MSILRLITFERKGYLDSIETSIERQSLVGYYDYPDIRVLL